MATFYILHSDQVGFEVTEKSFSFVLFSGFALFVDENDVIP